MSKKKEMRLNEWIEIIQARGEYSFSIDNAGKQLESYSKIALQRALSRLSEKGKISSIYKGYYLIIPPQYAQRRVLPPSLFIDSFFKYLSRPYYISLLNAASFHGASHQQPQEYFVVTNFPVMRATSKHGMRINYVSKDVIPEILLEKRKTEAGYINISNPILTATDLIQFEKRIGGINRVATILIELQDVLEPENFKGAILKDAPVSVLQRLGYLLENVCDNNGLALSLYEAMGEKGLLLHRIPLKPSAKTLGYTSNNRWKIIENVSIETDF